MHRGADHKAPLLMEDYEQLGEGITFFSSECSCYWQVAHALVHNHPLMLVKETIIIPNGSKKKASKYWGLARKRGFSGREI